MKTSNIQYKCLKIAGLIAAWIIGIAAGILLLATLFINIRSRIVCSEYYKIRTKVCNNPGLNNGFVPQGCTWDSENEMYLTLGYMKDASASRIYRINPKTRKYVYFTLKSNGNEFTDHTGGLQYFKGNFYIANESDGIYKFPASAFNDSEDNTIDIGSPIHIGNHTSFIFADKDYLYIGEFNNDNQYKCTNTVIWNGTAQNAIVEKFSGDDFSAPVAVYSIPNKVQGFAITDDGKIVLSTSWGLNDSIFYVFDESGIADTGTTYYDAPLYFLEKPLKLISAPPFSEDLDFKDGKIIYMAESACNKYWIGKFMFDYYIYSLDI